MALSTWWQSLPVLATAIAFIYVPGLVLTLTLGVRRTLDAAAFAPCVSAVVAGVAGIVFAPLGIGWSPTSYLLVATGLALCLICGRILVSIIRRRSCAIWVPSTDTDRHKRCAEGKAFGVFGLSPGSVRGVLPAVVGVIVAAGAVVWRLMAAIPSPERITENYDTVFHDNVVGRIILTGKATSLHALPGVRETYPIVFHQFAALAAEAVPGTAVSVAVTCVWIALAAVVWPISMLFLVRRIGGRSTVGDMLAPMLSAVAAGFPFILLEWGTLYAMFAGQSVLPVFLGLVWSWCIPDWRWERRMVIQRMSWIVLAMAAVSFLHFRVLMTGVLLALPAVVLWLGRSARVLWVRNRRMLWIAVGCIVTIAGVLAVCGAMVFHTMYLRNDARPISGHLNGPAARATEDIPSALVRYLLIRPIDSRGVRLPVYWPLVVVFFLAVLGIVVLRDRGGLILLASYVLLGLVFVSCAGSQDDWAKIVSALWYKDQRRPLSAWSVVGVPLICLAAVRFEKVLQVCVSRREIVTTTSATIAFLFGILSCFVNPQMTALGNSLALTYSFATSDHNSVLLSENEYFLMKRVALHVPRDQMVVSDPWNGSGLLLGVGLRTPYYAHLHAQWDDNRRYVAEHFSDIDTDPRVCAILRSNKALWFLSMGESFRPGDVQHRMFESLRVVPGAMTPVDRQGDAVLYRITACG